MIPAHGFRRSLGFGPALAALLLSVSLARAEQLQEIPAQSQTQATAPAASLSGSPGEPLTAGKRFKIAMGNSAFSPTAYLTAAAGAGYSMGIESDGDRGYGMGGKGFARRFADRIGSTTVSELVGSWIAASALRQDPRYYPSRKPNFGSRAAHAVSRVFITQSETGKSEFNASNMIGIVAGAGASIAWHRSRDRTPSNYFTTFGTYLGFNAVSNLAKEFVRKNKP